MKTIFAGTTLALAATIGLAAQSSTVKQRTKIEVKDGKEVTVTGCIRAADAGPGFLLTHVDSRNEQAGSTYALVGEDKDVAQHVGHLVEIRGKATDIGDDGKVEVTTKTKVEREHADDTHAKTHEEIKGPTAFPYLGVKSVKMLRDTCS